MRPDPGVPKELQVVREDSVELLGGIGHLPEEFRQVARLANKAGLDGLEFVDAEYGLDIEQAAEAIRASDESVSSFFDLDLRTRVKLIYRIAGGTNAEKKSS